MSQLESAKRKASYLAVDEQIGTSQVVGIGSGSTVVYAVERIGQLQREGKINVVCVPSSFQAQELIVKNNLSLKTLNEFPSIDVTFDGADEVDPDLNCIKGGGGCQLQEKLVIHASKRWFIVADYRKQSLRLGTEWKKGIPIETIPLAYKMVELELKKMGGAPTLRMATQKAGPVVTDNGNFIIDCVFDIKDPVSLNRDISMIPGVVETGLFCGYATGVYFGMEDGSVQSKLSQSKS